MNKAFALLLPVALAFGGCQTTPATTADSSALPEATTTPEATAAPEAAASSPAGAPTEAAARAAVGRYLQGQPNAALYQLDSAHAVNVDDHWQVLVPRTDWAQRMPNKAAFEVDKQTGRVTTRMVK
jgi:hypothetical protein